MRRIDRNGKGIVIVTDAKRRLLATITDGDVRRFLLSGESLDARVGDLVAARTDSTGGNPITATIDTDHAEMVQLMKKYGVRQLPVTDYDGCVVDIVTLDELVPESLSIQAMIMAGGFGSRLHPLTDDLPKPMLPMGDRPLLELTMERLRLAGIRRVSIATHHLADKITEYFGDGGQFGLDLAYVEEDRPLGTAGAIGLMQHEDPLLVINGDII